MATIKPIKRSNVLQEIFSNFQQMTQWVHSPANYAEYFNRAVSLIEILEVTDCGSVGGFDRKNPNKQITGFQEFDRFLTVLRKERNIIEDVCNFNIIKMSHYFKAIEKLREDCINGISYKKSC